MNSSRLKTPQKTHMANWIKGAIKKPSDIGERVSDKIPKKSIAKASKMPGNLGERGRMNEVMKSFKKAGK